MLNIKIFIKIINDKRPALKWPLHSKLDTHTFYFDTRDVLYLQKKLYIHYYCPRLSILKCPPQLANIFSKLC